MLSELQALAEALAQRLGRGVAIDDPELHLLVHTAHRGMTDRVRTQSILERTVDAELLAYVRGFGVDRASEPWVRVDAMPERDLMARLCAPIRAQGVLLGYLWIIEADAPLTDAQVADVVDVARSAAVVMHRERLLVDVERGRDRERLRDLLSDDETVRRAAVDALRAADRVPREEALQVLVAHVTGDAGGEELPQLVEDALDRVARRQGPPPALSLARGDHGVLLLDGRGAAPAAAVEAVRRDVLAHLPGTSLRTGLGQAVAGLEHVQRSWQQARQALRVGEVVPGFGPDVSWSELGVYRMLVHLPVGALPDDSIPSELLALLETDSGRELVRTVEAYLDRAGDARATAEALHVHRTSLYYRLTRFQTISGLDLGNGNDRLAVHLALKLLRLDDQL
jgi:hypothetical protein